MKYSAIFLLFILALTTFAKNTEVQTPIQDDENGAKEVIEVVGEFI